MRKNQVRKGFHVPDQRQTNKRSSVTVWLLTLAIALLLTACGNKSVDTTNTDSLESTTAKASTLETLESSSEEPESTSPVETEEETKETEEETEETKEETEPEGSESADEGDKSENGEKETTGKGESTKESTKETTKAASQTSQNQTTAGSTSGNSGNSSQTKPSGNTGSTGNTQKPTQQETTKAPVTLSSIKATYTGGTKTEGGVVSGAEISVTATYSDGSSKAVNGWSCDKANQSLPAGSHTFTVTYEGKSSSFTVNVQAAPTTAAPTQPAQPQQPATSQAYIDEFMRGFNQARLDYGMPADIGVNAKWSRYAQYYAEYHAKKWPGNNWENDAEHSGLELDWWPSNEGIGYAYTAYDAGYDQAIHVGAYQHKDFGNIGVGIYYSTDCPEYAYGIGRYYVCVQQWESAEKGEVPFPSL